MVLSDDFRDRARGLLVGLAIGDAIGAPVEFDPPASIAGRRDELFAMPGGGSFDWAPGEFTDDSQMALVLARHLRERDGALEQDALAADFAAWADDARDVGIQTRTVLDAVSRGEGWRSATAALAATAAGNGSLMRVAPVAIAAATPEDAAALARAQSAVTHPNESCLDACAVFASALWDALDGGVPSLEELARRARTESVTHAIERAASGPAPEMSGWVLHTLTGALWAEHGTTAFGDAVWRAVSLGHDADTVGAVAGALAGARWGLHAIPRSLSERLQSRHPMFVDDYPAALIALADALAESRGARLPDRERGEAR